MPRRRGASENREKMIARAIIMIILALLREASRALWLLRFRVFSLASFILLFLSLSLSFRARGIYIYIYICVCSCHLPPPCVASFASRTFFSLQRLSGAFRLKFRPSVELFRRLHVDVMDTLRYVTISNGRKLKGTSVWLVRMRSP